MTQRYLRKYKLTIGLPLTFYEGTVSSEILTTPPERLAQRAVRNEQLAKAARDLTNAELKLPVAIVGTNFANVVGPNPNNNLLDPDRRKYEAFLTDQKDLIEQVNVQQAKGSVIEQLNIAFDLAKGEDDTNNTITIYNASNDTVALLNQRGTKFNPVVTLEAGYENDSTLALAYKGEVVHYKDVWEGSTRITTLYVKAAPTAQKEAYTIRSYKKDTPVSQIVNDVIKDMRLNYGVLYIPEQDGTEIKVDKNYYVQCQSWEGLVNLCGQYELKATIEDGKVNVTPKSLFRKGRSADQVEQFLNVGLKVDRTTGEVKLGGSVFNAGSLTGIPSTSVPPINTNPFTPRPQTPAQTPQTFNDGLVAPFTVQRFDVQFDRTVAKAFNTASGSIIGSPVTEGGNSDSRERSQGKADVIKIKIFLDATMKESDVVSVESNNYTGIYRVNAIRHYGEYEGRDWYTELTLEALDSWVVGTGVDEDNLKALDKLRASYSK